MINIFFHLREVRSEAWTIYACHASQWVVWRVFLTIMVTSEEIIKGGILAEDKSQNCLTCMALST